MSEKLYLIEGDGRRRKAEHHNCENCDIKFLRRLGGKQRYCKPKCASLARRNRIKLSCYNCSKIFERTKQKIDVTKNNVHFCSRTCKDYAQSLDGGCKEIQAPHYGSVDSNWICRIVIDRLDNPKCVQCYENKRYLLVVHHIDGNRNNNSLNNLEIVCGSCHMKRHMKIANNEWRYDSSCLTPRVEIWSL